MTSFLEQEIAEQPEALARFLESEEGGVARLVSGLPAFGYALIAARGTSDHAAIYAKYAWGAVASVPVALAAPSLHTLYGAPPRMDGALVVGISQSGQSPDIVAVLEEAKRQSRPTLAITSDGASPLAGVADHALELHAGPERSVAATKTYTTQLAAVALLAAALGGRRERLDELRRLPEVVAATLEAAAEPAASAAERLLGVERCAVIGRGYNYATALELALKLKELTYADVGAYSSADFRHGPIATVGEGSAAILVTPNDSTFRDMASLADELRYRGADLVKITDGPAESGFRLPFVTPDAQWLNPVPAITPGQLLALRSAVAKGLDPDGPRGLQKVTRTL